MDFLPALPDLAWPCRPPSHLPPGLTSTAARQTGAIALRRRFCAAALHPSPVGTQPNSAADVRLANCRHHRPQPSKC